MRTSEISAPALVRRRAPRAAASRCGRRHRRDDHRGLRFFCSTCRSRCSSSPSSTSHPPIRWSEHYRPSAFPRSVLSRGRSAPHCSAITVTASGPAPLIATALLAWTGSGYSIALYILVSAVISIAATVPLPDYTNRDISEEPAYGYAPVDSAVPIEASSGD
jgi:hypothetical protein